jgi:hypothetical protein
MAKMLIDDLHPIKQTRIDTAYPIMCCPLGFLRKSFGKSEEDKLAEKREVLHALEK